jgi:hypothetical protein
MSITHCGWMTPDGSELSLDLFKRAVEIRDHTSGRNTRRACIKLTPTQMIGLADVLYALAGGCVAPDLEAAIDASHASSVSSTA